MNCKYCAAGCKKAGKQRNGVQKWYCSGCVKYQQEEYQNRAYLLNIDGEIKRLLKEGCGTRSIARLLSISPNTVSKRIVAISKSIQKPPVALGKTYEMDEMCTYLGKKKRLVWVAYAIRKDTREVVDFRVGPRTNKTLRAVIETLCYASAKAIYTDGLSNYRYLIPKAIHKTTNRGINYIERKNLTLRTHLKRLNRRTLCFSKSITMLSACLRIYFWG